MVPRLSTAGAAALTASRSDAQGAGQTQGRYGGHQLLATLGHLCRCWHAKESSEGWEGSVKSLSISAQGKAPSLSSGEMTYLCSCTSCLVRGAALGTQALVRDVWGTVVVEICPLLLPRALGAGQDLLLIPHFSSSIFSKARSPSGPIG